MVEELIRNDVKVVLTAPRHPMILSISRLVKHGLNSSLLDLKLDDVFVKNMFKS